MSDILTPKEYADYSREWKMGISIGPNLGACFCATIDALAEALRAEFLRAEQYLSHLEEPCRVAPGCVGQDEIANEARARVAAWLE